MSTTSKATKTKNESNKKDSQLIIRINGQQRDEFVALCEDLDTSAAREIRHFIKRFMAENRED
ncbi:hypothetical protein L3Q72_16200 [Vibrio sp. JC009]|uniref:hypothetical protein n=1 Tax=Vibrio sp. JC009 TaxID=2912314 RepID=UPI0023B17A77|nr:hypothetical protein [Vibrio sp. JC009]WED24419.1 hypothetical protein L3Q72_16200 [Vibrio sp. JC009]